MDRDSLTPIENNGISVSVKCVQYLISHHMKTKSVIKKDDLMKTVFKNNVIGKNYNIIMKDVENTLHNVFGYSLSNIKNDKQFLIINNMEKIDIPGIISYSPYNNTSKYRVLLKPIITALIMLRSPISEGQMWNIMEEFSKTFNLDMHHIKTVVKGEFVKDQYLQYKATDETTIMFDPEKTSYWFSLGPRALIECDPIVILERISELYKIPRKSFKRVYAQVTGNK